MEARPLRTVISSALLVVLFSSGLNAATLKEIDKRGIVRIGVKENLPLMGQIDPTGQRSGFEIELAQNIIQTIWGDRIQIEFIPLLNQHRLPAVTEGTVDMAIANLHVTDSRRRVVFFSQPYLTSRTSFATRVPLHAPFTDLRTRTIGVLQGSIAIGRLRANFPESNLIGLKSYPEAIQALEAGTIDSFAGDALILRGWQYGTPLPQKGEPSSKMPFHFSPDGIGFSPIAIAMPKGLQYRNLHDAVDLALETLEQSGQLQQMRNKWRLSLEDRAALDRLEAAPES